MLCRLQIMFKLVMFVVCVAEEVRMGLGGAHAPPWVKVLTLQAQLSMSTPGGLPKGYSLPHCVPTAPHL